MSGEGVGETEEERDVEGVCEGVPLLVREGVPVADGVEEREGERESVGEPLAVGESVPLLVGETLLEPLKLAVTVLEGVREVVLEGVHEVLSVPLSLAVTVGVCCRRRGAPPLVENHAGSKGAARAKDASSAKTKRGRNANICVWLRQQRFCPTRTTSYAQTP
jgi:hypothetical protein